MLQNWAQLAVPFCFYPQVEMLRPSPGSVRAPLLCKPSPGCGTPPVPLLAGKAAWGCLALAFGGGLVSWACVPVEATNSAGGSGCGARLCWVRGAAQLAWVDVWAPGQFSWAIPWTLHTPSSPHRGKAAAEVSKPHSEPCCSWKC